MVLEKIEIEKTNQKIRNVVKNHLNTMIEYRRILKKIFF